MCSFSWSVGVVFAGRAARIVSAVRPRALGCFNPFAAAIMRLVGLTTFSGGEDPRIFRVGFTVRPRLDFFGFLGTIFAVGLIRSRRTSCEEDNWK